MTDRHQSTDDRYARESFTFRMMKRWQVWALSAIAIAVLVAIFVYSGV